MLAIQSNPSQTSLLLDPAAPGSRRERLDRIAVLLDTMGDGLPVDERAVLAAYVSGRSLAEVAAIGGCSGGVVRTRIRRVIRRLRSPQYSYVLRHRDSLPRTRRAVAEACFLRGSPVRKVALELRLTQHAVRRHRAAIEALCDGASS